VHGIFSWTIAAYVVVFASRQHAVFGANGQQIRHQTKLVGADQAK
jgi:hypothetical protein